MTTAPLGPGGSVPLAVLERDGFPESVHQGALAVVRPDGEVIARGDVDLFSYPRSALKPFQTIAAERCGAAFTAEQRVIVTSSHTGTARHVDLVRSVLTDAGLDDSALQTPATRPADGDAARALVLAGDTPAPIHMTCSGNHAGMLAAAVAGGWSTGDYLDRAHRVHAAANDVIAEYTGVTPAYRSTDGCGGPVWAVPVVALARGYQALFAAHPDLAAAIRALPELIEGPGTATTRAVAELGLVAKMGADGTWVAVAPDGTAAAVKILDGGLRAAAAVVVAALAAAGAVDGEAADRFLSDPSLEVRGGGAVVGRIRPV